MNTQTLKGKNIPAFTIASLCAPILVGLLSYPLCLHYLRDSDPTGKAGYFVVVALLILMTLAVSLGSLLGLAFAIVAHLKKEAWLPMRMLIVALNLSLISFGCLTYLSLPKSTSVEQYP